MTAETDFLDTFFQSAIDKIVANLFEMHDTKGRNRYASGVTGQEVGQFNKDMVNEYVTKWVVQIYMPSYYEFIDEGVKGWQNEKKNTGKFGFKKNGKPIPKQAIMEFMRNRGIVFSGFKEKKKSMTKVSIKKKLESLAYIIGRSIKKKGIEGVPFYSSVMSDDFFKSFETEFLNFYGDKLLNDIEFIFKPSGKQ